MNMFKKIISQSWTRYLLMALAGLFLGWLFFKDSEPAHQAHDHAAETDASVWTCSMHPQIRQAEPGKCPICGMDLIPLATLEDEEGEGTNPALLQMTTEAIALANVSVSPVQKAQAENQLTLTGKIQADEQRIATISSTFPGRVERLYVSFTGQEVKRGQRLATIYSPDLMTAQRELIEAAAYKSVNPELYEAAREKLRLWRINENQINAIEESGVVKNQFDVYADKSGYVVNRLVSEGDYVSRGRALLEVVDLSRLWVMLDAYESDLAWINIGDKLEFSVAALPGEKFQAEVAYIDPGIDPETRAASARAEVSNRSGKLKPEMFVNATITSRLGIKEESLVVPRTSVLWTGKRSVVYVKAPGEKPAFEMRAVNLGPRMGELYVIEAGLEAGEEVVTNGVFSVDAAAQLQGKVSMMNPEGERTSSPHDHGGMEGSQTPSAETESLEGSDKAFKQQLGGLLTPYIDIKEALFNAEEEEAAETARNMQSSLNNVNMTSLTGDAHKVWMEKANNLDQALTTIAGTADISNQRESFSDLSAELYTVLKQFEIDGLDAYYQYCPMARNDQGAYWLSKTEAIRNPYFGESMATCGSTEDRLE